MNEERKYAVLVEPHSTEKAANVGDLSNAYAFKVATDATKPEIKEAVQSIFGVSVVNVTTLNQKGKVKRNWRRRPSRKKDWKKAYVRLAAGDEIDFAAER